jgi:hypothetical protein
MADEWVKLTAADKEWNKAKIYVNLSNATSIWPKEKGSEIWFFRF